MSMIVEPIQHSHTQIVAVRIQAVDFIKNVDLQFSSFTVFVYVLDDL